MSNQKGFTLVELVIVMTIIGLLIGGVLKGQELIVNARVASAANMINAMTAANTTFKDMYGGLPGDISGDKIPACEGNAACNTRGNGGYNDGKIGKKDWSL